MNDTYINYIDHLLDLSERNVIFCLTSRAFNEFVAEVRETMVKGKPMKPVIEQGAPSYYGGSGICREYCACPKCGDAVGRGDDKANYCPECGQKIDWTED